MRESRGEDVGSMQWTKGVRGPVGMWGVSGTRAFACRAEFSAGCAVPFLFTTRWR